MIKIENIISKIKIKQNMQIADFGCGISNNLFFINNSYPDLNLNLYFVDINKNVLERIYDEQKLTKKSSNTLNTIWTNIDGKKIEEFQEGSLDIIFLENVYTYLIHKKASILEFKKLLKVGGKIVFIDKHTAYPKSVFVQQILPEKSHVEKTFEDAGFLVYPIEIESAKYSYAFIAENANRIKIETK